MKKGGESRPAPGLCWWLFIVLAVCSASFMGAMLGTRFVLEGKLGAPCKRGAEDDGGAAGKVTPEGGGETMSWSQDDVAVAAPTPASTAPAAAPVNSGGGGVRKSAFDVDARMRQQWREITAMCSKRLYKSCANIDRWGAHWPRCGRILVVATMPAETRQTVNLSSCFRSTWTDSSKTRFSALEFAGLGSWSTFTIKTHDRRDRPKAKGGDTWAITLREEDQQLK